MPDPTALDAIDGAIESLKPTEPVVETAPAAAAPEGETAPDGGETAPAEEVVETPDPGEETLEVDAELEAAETADGPKRGADGKFAKKEGEAPVAKKEGEAPAPVAKKEPAKTDHVNDPIPDEVKGRTRERITSLAATVKELEPIRAAHNELVSAIQQSGMNAEEFNTSLRYAELIRSPNIEDLRVAHKFLQGELAAISARIGETLPGKDPLEGHPDLIDLVAKKLTTPELAKETAQHRNRTAAASKFNADNANATQAEQEYEQTVTAAKTNLTALGKQLEGSLGAAEYARRYAIVVPQMQVAFKSIDPSRWVATMRSAFAQVPAAPVPATVVPAAPAKQTPQPLRANKVPAGNSNAAPKSAQEAMDQALAQMR
jgi:hypothetical protein